MPDQSGIQFHFLEPAWLLALLPLALLLWFAARNQAGDTPWRRIIDARLQPLLMNGGNAARSRLATRRLPNRPRTTISLAPMPMV
jgi:hypothetical protein